LACTNSTYPGNWLNFSGTFDLIHFNFGLHDLVYCNSGGECKEHVDLPVYGKNILEIYNRLSKRAKIVMWTTTTPVPNVTTSLGRNYSAVLKYNAMAKTSLPSDVPIDDLFDFVIKHCEVFANHKMCNLPHNV
jgi:hypothetical protein